VRFVRYGFARSRRELKDFLGPYTNVPLLRPLGFHRRPSGRLARSLCGASSFVVCSRRRIAVELSKESVLLSGICQRVPQALVLPYEGIIA
jgi:hypothetical protein